MTISWFPRNFTNPDYTTLDQNLKVGDDALYSVQLGLYVIGYKESLDEQVSSFSDISYMVVKFFRKTFKIYPNENDSRFSLLSMALKLKMLIQLYFFFVF